MTEVLVLQSFREHEVASWHGRCLHSVAAWSASHGYAYEYCGDELFDRLPTDYASKVGGRKPIAADLARLLWIQACLQEKRAEVVLWLDADTYVFAPEKFQLTLQDHAVFGYEHWLQKRPDKAGYRVHKNVHNAYCAFRIGSPLLPFLVDVVQRMVARADPEHIAPQFVGPKLLTSLHNIVGFAVDSRLGAISPDLQQALLRGDLSLVERLKLPQPMVAANLCGSLHEEDDPQLAALLDVLDQFKSGLI